MLLKLHSPQRLCESWCYHECSQPARIKFNIPAPCTSFCCRLPPPSPQAHTPPEPQPHQHAKACHTIISCDSVCMMHITPSYIEQVISEPAPLTLSLTPTPLPSRRPSRTLAPSCCSRRCRRWRPSLCSNRLCSSRVCSNSGGASHGTSRGCGCLVAMQAGCGRGAVVQGGGGGGAIGGTQGSVHAALGSGLRIWSSRRVSVCKVGVGAELCRE